MHVKLRNTLSPNEPQLAAYFRGGDINVNSCPPESNLSRSRQSETRSIHNRFPSINQCLPIFLISKTVSIVKSTTSCIGASCSLDETRDRAGQGMKNGGVT